MNQKYSIGMKDILQIPKTSFLDTFAPATDIYNLHEVIGSHQPDP
jgi:hypothetical protein